LSQQFCTATDRAARVFGVDGSVLAQLVPVAWVREVLAEAQVVSRTRRTSAVAGVYLVLALTLFPKVSTTGVFEKLSGRWGRPGAQVPSAASWKQRRASLGEAPFRLLFHRLRSAGAEVPGARWAGLLVCAWDGTTVQVPDSADNAAAFGKKACHTGSGPFPLVQVLALVACGSRALIDVVFDAIGVGENTLARRLITSLTPGMLLLADRGFTDYALWCDSAGTGAELLWRIRRDVRLNICQVLPDGSALAWWKIPKAVRLAQGDRLPPKVLVRVISGWVGVVDEHGIHRGEPYRLLSTLTDHQTHPATGIVWCYGRRWQIELTFKGLKTVQGATRLRSRTPAGVRQEMWAWLSTHQLLRLQAARAADQAAGPGPAQVRQISFTTLVRRLGEAVTLTAGGRHDAATTLASLQQATAEDITPIDTRIRVFDRVLRQPFGKYPTKRSHHQSRTATAYDYAIDRLDPENEPATGKYTWDINTKINS
jgi:Transposase DDE domain/Insertion element 4 transposase N-terminal